MRRLLSSVIGHSVEGRPILVHSGDPGGTLIIGGFHGDEPASIELVREFLPAPGGAVAVIPELNPDGAVRETRYNAHGVDLNRNFGFNWHAGSEEPSGPEPWSEPETRALRDFIHDWRPAHIVALHWALGEIDADGQQSSILAQAMWNAMSAEEQRPYRLRIRPDDFVPIQRPELLECPGSLGQWAGYGVVYPGNSRPAMITLELPHDPLSPRPEILSDDHLEVIRAHWSRDAAGYLSAVRSGVAKMLRAACGMA